MALIHRRGSGILDAIDCFREATAADPGYAPAHAGIAQGLALATFWGILTPEEVHQPALDAAARALALEPGLVASQVAAALVAVNVEFDRAKAAIHWDRAMEIAPADVDARANRAVFHLGYALTDLPAAIDELRAAQVMDPLNHFLLSQLAITLAFGDRPAEAEVVARQAITMDSSAFYPQWILFMALAMQAQMQAALELGLSIIRRFGRTNWVLMGMANVYAGLGRPDEAAATYEELLARSRTEYVQPTVLALGAMSAGRRKEAVEWLQRAATDHDAMLLPTLFCLQLPAARALRNEPEHAAVVRELAWNVPLPASRSIG